MKKITIFRHPVTSTEPWMEVAPREVYERVKSGTYHDVTEELRMLNDADQRRRFKGEKLDYVLFSGTFGKRTDRGLKEHSGLICLDFDHVANFQRVWNSMKADKNLGLVMMFRSPSGDGIKAVVNVGETKPEEHGKKFDRLKAYVSLFHGADADKSGRNVSRACFLCHDPEAYYNENENENTFI